MMSANSPKTRTNRSTTAQPSRRRTAEEARREIMDSATRLLWKRPFRDLNVGELMAGTSLSRPAFYQYFVNLHEMIEALLAEVETVMHAAANPWVEGEGEPIAALRETLEGVVQTCVDYGPILRAVAEAAPFDKQLEQAWATFFRNWDDPVEARIKAQQREGLIPPLNARRIAHALNALDVALLIPEFGQRPQGDPRAELDTLHGIWVATLYGQAPSKLAPAKPGRNRRS